MIGAPITRREDARVLRGETRYLDDLDRDGLGHVAVVRSPHAHAGITHISAPDTADGLIAIVTAAELDGTVRPFPVTTPAGAELADQPHPVLAAGEVRYAGQPVALVIATTRALAEDAAELVEVEYEPRAAVVEPRRSEVELMRWERRAGDPDAAFAAAAHVVSGRYALPRLAAVPIETRGCLAEYDPAGDTLTVWGSFQDPHRPREQLAHILGRDPATIRVVVPDVGGAFGSKGVIAPEVAAVAAAAIRLGRPLKWTEDRLENLVAAYQGRGLEGDLELALDADGRMLALRAHLWADLGGYLLTTTPIPAHTAATLICGVYDLPVADVRLTGRLTHKVPTGPYRGAGRPDAAYMIEALVDRAARELGIAPAELRWRNLVRDFPYVTATGLEYDSGDYPACLDLALELSDAEPTTADGALLRGRGLGMYVERAGGAFESAVITAEPGGRFTVATSASSHGQGHDITFAQIAADRLSVGVDAITVVYGDSAAVPAGVGTFGSRSTAQAGSAIALAAEELARTGAPRAEARFSSANVFSSGAYVADVTVDPATGATAVTRLVAVDDAGTLINPLLVHGQVIGGAVQALGECLTEMVGFDEGGQNTTGSLLDYSLLTAAEIPLIVTGAIETPSPLNPLGAKGAGEGGAIGTLPAVANAVTAALGGRHLDPPYTAERVWRALQEAPPTGVRPSPPADAARRGADAPPRGAPDAAPRGAQAFAEPGSPDDAEPPERPAWVTPALAALTGAGLAVIVHLLGRRR